MLHDLGKLAVSNQFLDKPGKLDAAEWKAIRTHPTTGSTILSRIRAFADIAPIACNHHERLDGKGYPNGLSAEQLSAEVRIVTEADAFDALSAARPYRAAIPFNDVFAILGPDRGTAFDPDCINALR